MFVNANGPLPGMDFAFPDVCKTPIAGVPVPLPYPNLAMEVTTIPPQMVVFLMMMPAHNMAAVKELSLGDTPGLELGLIGPFDMGPARHEFGSTNLFLGGPPATKLTSPTGQNGLAPNAVGATIVPSQIVLLSLR